MTKNKRASRWIWLLPLLPVCLGVVLLAADTRPQQALRHALFDQYQRWQPRVHAETPVRIVDIDEESLARLGQWPWPRTRLAELVAKLGAGGAAAVVFDVMFAEPDRTSPRAVAELWNLRGELRAGLEKLPDHDAAFARALAAGDTVIGFATERAAAGAGARSPAQKARFIHMGEPQPRWLHAFGGAVTSLPAFEAAARGNGALSFVPDSDGVVRRVPLVLRLGDAPVATLATEALRVAQGMPNVILKWTEEGAGLAEARIGDVVVPTTPQGEVWVHYAPRVAARSVSAWQVLAGELDPARLAGHIVLVGSSAQGLMDLRFSPFGLMPGVEAHAQALEQILAGQFLERPSWARGVEALALVAGGLLIGFVALRAHALWAAGACLLLLAVLGGGAWRAFSAHGLLLDAATPTVGVLLTFIVGSLWHHFSSEREQRWIKEAFARYVSPNRVRHLVEHPGDMALGGRRQECSFVFTDLAGFTSLMEKIDPGEAVALLNAYLDEMIAIAFRHEGTLDRIVGDAVAIMFSAPVPQPDHRRRALACALEMDAFASRYSAEQQAQGIAFGRTRIGVHAGTVTVGNFGGSTMFDYRALGDPINTAARLESANKHLGTRMCISAAILEGCAATPVRPVGRLILKGKTDMIEVFEPLLPELEAGYAPLDGYLAAFAAMQACSGSALALFERLLADNPGDPLVKLHRNRLLAGERGELIVMQGK